VSKALPASKNTPAQYFFVFKAVEIVSGLMQLVGCRMAKPNWKLGKFLFSLVMTERRFSNIFSRILPRTSRRLMGRYEDGFSGGLPGLSIVRTTYDFQFVGK